MPHSPWWTGKKGEWYVVGQAALMVLVLLGPRTLAGWPPWTPFFAQLGSVAGLCLMLLGLLLMLAGGMKLGPNLIAVPYPREKGTLVDSGPYRIVRHPIYFGGNLMSFGWALWTHGWLTIGYAVLVFVFLDIKSMREEEWLKQKYSGYTEYQKHVRRLIPFLY